MQADPSPLPLAAYNLFETDDLDRAREEVARVFCPHKLTPLGPQRSRALHNSVGIGGLSLNFITYGADIRIEPGELERFYLFQIPLSGSARVACGRQSAIASPQVATILSPSLKVAMDWSADCRKLLVQIDRRRVEQALEALLGRSIARPVDFALAFERGGARERIVRLVDLIREDIDSGEGTLFRGLGGRQIGETLVTALLRCQPHSYSHALEVPSATVAPRQVKRAEAHMREHLAEPLTLADLAASAGVSVRALQDGFRRFRDMTPLEALRLMRMEAARADLLAGDEETSVTGVALRWGFGHLGRFAQHYRQRYGESPSDSLRRGAASSPSWPRRSSASAATPAPPVARWP